MPEHRLRRVAEQLQQEIGSLLIDGVKDPRIGFVTVTEVRVSPDLGYAKVYYTALGDERTLRRVRSGLKSSAAWLRAEISRRLRMKRIPQLDFVYDDSLQRATRIERILDGLRADSEPEPEPAEGSPASDDEG